MHVLLIIKLLQEVEKLCPYPYQPHQLIDGKSHRLTVPSRVDNRCVIEFLCYCAVLDSLSFGIRVCVM